MHLVNLSSRLREGPLLNKSLLGFSSTLSTLSRDGTSQFVNYEECVLTKLLAGGWMESF